MSDIQIRALMQIDNLQPKFAAYNGATVQGSVPLSGDTVLIGEFAPGNGVFSLIDRALKASSVEATTQLVEREFGFFILRSPQMPRSVRRVTRCSQSLAQLCRTV